MDGAMEKLNVYDFLSVFLAGLFTVTAYCFAGLPVPPVQGMPDGVVFDVLAYLLVGYFVGLVQQEASSAADRFLGVFRLREKARERCLVDGLSSVRNPLELAASQKRANELLGKGPDNRSFTPSECEYVYFCWRSDLEVAGKDGKIKRTNSLFGMSRGLSLGFLTMAVIYLVTKWCTGNPLVFVGFVLLSALCLGRARRFAGYMVDSVLRLHSALKPQ